jgi:formylglycine-generating enzyme required for sulfatase activity
MKAICDDEPEPVRKLNPGVPEGLATLIHEMLAKKPVDRPASAEEVVKRLRRVGTEKAGEGGKGPGRSGTSAPPPTRKDPAHPTRTENHVRPFEPTPASEASPTATENRQTMSQPRLPWRGFVPWVASIAVVVTLLAVSVWSPGWITSSTVSLDLGGGVTMEFVRIPAGEFLMGAPEGEDEAENDEKPQHRVRISRDFYLGKYPVTQEQYQAVMGTNPSYFCASGKGKDKVLGLDTRQFPVESVSWDEATAFCEKLSARTGRRVTLPSEAEWEYACRAGTTTAFYFGDALDGTQANCDGTKPFGTEVKGPYLDRTSRVGSYLKDYPHPWGLGDPHGNVWQWCQDWYDAGYYKRTPHVDPLCTDGERRSRVVRAGSWNNFARNCRTARRDWRAPSIHIDFVGFRAALRPGRGGR